MLTTQQHAVWTYICKHVRENGVAPTYRQICAGVGFKSPQQSHAMVSVLCELGYVRKAQKKKQGIEVLKWPEDLEPFEPETMAGWISGGEIHVAGSFYPDEADELARWLRRAANYVRAKG